MSGAGLLNSFTDEGALAITPDDARWTPIELDFDVPATMSVVIVARIGDNSVLTMVVFTDEFTDTDTDPASGLQPLFTGKSTITVTGTIAAGRNIVISILPNGGWIRPEVVIVPYVA